ncbi:MAG: undecaprenyl-diphosphate phosphatase [Elusimicrobiales bacterium]|jgi:undecaprenyl-diphosphatase
MTELHAIILGILQGVGEFLPISSSAHLALAPYLFGWRYQGLAYDVMLHLGTLLAIAVYFAPDWMRIITAGLKSLRRTGPAMAGAGSRPKPEENGGSLLWLLAAGSVPAAAAGLLLNHKAEHAFRDPAWIAFDLIFFSGLIYLADRAPSQKKTTGDLGLKDIMLIGLAQSLALMPGASRSGMTIMAALFLGYARYDAARISFLLATPVIFGAGLLEARKLTPADLNAAFAAGIIAAFIAGMLSIKFLLSYLKNRDLKPFIAYRIMLGLFIVWKILH